MNNRAYISASSNYFSGEGEVKRRRLDIEERRLLLDEKEQVIRMVNIGVYTPQTARDKIEEIDQRMRLPPSKLHMAPRCKVNLPWDLTVDTKHEVPPRVITLHPGISRIQTSR